MQFHKGPRLIDIPSFIHELSAMPAEQTKELLTMHGLGT
jgi:hypothetical protein